MAVDVHVHHSQAAAAQRLDGDDRIVEDTEAGGVARRGVMQAAGDVEGHVYTALGDELRRH